MKKLVSIILALAMLSSLQIFTSAEESNVTIEYDVAASFTVVIPETISVVGGKATETISVSAGSLIHADETLEITVSASANYANGFRMVNSRKSNVFIGYSITEGENRITLGDTLLSATADEVFAGKETTITITATTPTVAGTYSDVLTFSIGTVK